MPLSFPFIRHQGICLKSNVKVKTFETAAQRITAHRKTSPEQKDQRQEKTMENKPCLTNEKVFFSVFRQSIVDNYYFVLCRKKEDRI